MNELQKFFKENEVKIGIDYTLGTPLYYDSLRSGFFHYFSTYLDHKNLLPLILDSYDWTKDTLSHSALEYNLSQSILSFHRFFELFLKDVLRKINPYLAVKFIEKTEDLFEFLDGDLPAENIKSIEFGEALKRFRQAYQKYLVGSDVYESYLKDIHFLYEKSAKEALEVLSEWRNRIMHNGSTFPNLFAYEYLITQRIIPLIYRIVDLEKKKSNFEPHYFATLSGIETVKELTNISFNHNDSKNTKEQENLRFKFYKIAHLKELGRASFTQDFYRRKDRDYKEPKYNSPIERAERFAQAEKAMNQECCAINTCNCCNAKSQVVYRREFIDLNNQKDFSMWLRCFNCDYTIALNLYDPKHFGLSVEPLFPRIDLVKETNEQGVI